MSFSAPPPPPPPPALATQKWLLAIPTTTLSFLLLSYLYLNPRWLAVPLLESLPHPPLAAVGANPTGFSEASVNPSPIWLRLPTPTMPLPSSESTAEEPDPPKPISDLAPSPTALERAPPPPPPLPPPPFEPPPPAAKSGKCDIFDGKWVYDPKRYPLYQGRQCPFLSDQVSCQRNGRPDSNYEHWRWQPNGCQILTFNGTDTLERLRGKRIVIVGDSLNRNQWESLVCLLYSSVHPSRASVNLLTYPKIFRALDYGCSVEFFWDPLIVPVEGKQPKVLKLDKIHGSAKRWRGADVMLFNTGHWWPRGQSHDKWDYFERGGKLVEKMDVEAAFEAGLKTWARWVDRFVDPTKTKVFFRSIAARHIPESKQWCYNQTRPSRDDESYIQWFPKSLISVAERTVRRMRTPVEYLNITRLSEYRRDAHAGVYTTRGGKLLTAEERRHPELRADCNHWCLPGLPDTWNVLMLASISGSPSVAL